MHRARATRFLISGVLGVEEDGVTKAGTSHGEVLYCHGVVPGYDVASHNKMSCRMDRAQGGPKRVNLLLGWASTGGHHRAARSPIWIHQGAASHALDPIRRLKATPAKCCSHSGTSPTGQGWHGSGGAALNRISEGLKVSAEYMLKLLPAILFLLERKSVIILKKGLITRMPFSKTRCYYSTRGVVMRTIMSFKLYDFSSAFCGSSMQQQIIQGLDARNVATQVLATGT